MSVSDDIASRFVHSQDDGIGGSLIQTASLTDGFHKPSSQGQEAQLTWNAQGKRRQHRHTFRSGACLGGPSGPGPRGPLLKPGGGMNPGFPGGASPKPNIFDN